MKGLDLHDALTEIDESFIKEADQVLTNSRVCEMTNATQEFRSGKTRRKALRVVLIAACLVVLLVGTVYAATKELRAKPFLELIGTAGNEEELVTGFVPIEETIQFDHVRVTLEDIIGDRYAVYAELSTDYELDEPDGWLMKEMPVKLRGDGEAVFPDDELRGCMNGYAPFGRDGRLWYLFVISYNDPDVDLSHLPMQLRIGGADADGNTFSHTFEWVNNYEAKSEIIAINKEVNGLLLTDIRFSLTRMDVYYETEEEHNFLGWEFPLDYIKLDDGKILKYSRVNGMTIQGDRIASGSQETAFFNLLSGFSEDGVFRLVPYERIQSVCVDGEEIRIR